jgi:hypothetical protein
LRKIRLVAPLGTGLQSYGQNDGQEGDIMNTQENFDQMLNFLHRGGDWSYWWTSNNKLTYWWLAGHPAAIPEGVNTYFGVHPANKKGAKTERSKTETITAINCLFAEFDEDKGSTIDAICHLPCMPSILIRSGGGWHGYWLLREPFVLATDADREHAKELQAAWVSLVGGDTGAKDLARVLRVPGTLNHKYNPPRLVDFTWADFNLIYDLANLEALCKPLEKTKPAVRAQDKGNGRSSSDAGEHWLSQAFLRASIGNRNETGFWLSCQLRDAGLGKAEAEKILRDYAAQVPQASGDPYGDREALASVKSAYTGAAREPAQVRTPRVYDKPKEPAMNMSPENFVESDTTIQAPKTRTYDRLWTVTDLLETEFPEPEWIIPGKIATGFSILGGRPKKGKTWLALQIAKAKATGGLCLGERVEKGRVLFLALEDSPRRLKKRCENQGIPKGTDIDFRVTWRKFDKGGLDDLLVEVVSEKYSLIIIDCLSRAMGKFDQLDLSEMSYLCGELQTMAIQHNANLLAIDHHGKMEYGNPVDDTIGSTGKSLAADTLIGLYRDTGKHEATLKIIGRDLEDELEIALQWEASTCTWQSLGDAGAVRANTLKADVLHVIKELVDMGKLATTTRIAQYLKADVGNVSKALGDLLVAGQVKRAEKVGREVPYVLQ